MNDLAGLTGRPPFPSRLASTHLIAPLLLGSALIAGLVLASLLAPPIWRSTAQLATGTVIVLAAFTRWPKPTLLVFALFVLFYDSIGRWLGPGVRQLDETIIPGLVVIAAWRQKPWRRELIQPIRDGAVVALIALAVVSSLANAVPLQVWLVSLLLMAKPIGFLYVVLWHDYQLADIRQATFAVLGVGIAVMLAGAAELVVGPQFRAALQLSANADVRGQLPGISSVFLFPVLFSWFGAFVSIGLLAYYIVFRRLWLLIGAMLFGMGVFLSGRRRAIAGIVVGLVGGLLVDLRLAVSRRRLLRLWAPVAVGALVLAIVFLPGLTELARRTVNELTRVELAVPEPVDDIQGQGNWYVQANPRVVLYLASADIAADHFPLGAGLGRYGSPMSRIQFSPLYSEYGLDRIWGLTPQMDAFVTDTFWPHLLGETGVFGLAAYLVFMSALLVGLWRAAHAPLDPYLRAFCLAAWMVFLHALVESLASSMFESPPRIYLLFGSAAMALALLRAAGTRPEPVERSLPDGAPRAS